MSGTVAGIYIATASGEPMKMISRAEIETDLGIVGDRYHAGTGTFSEKLQDKGQNDWQVTLIEAEEIDAFNTANDQHLGYGEFRRNIVTNGVRLNHFVGRQLQIGDVILEGMRLCEPCALLAGQTDSRILPVMIGRSGLRTRVIQGGAVSIGKSIRVAD